MSEPAPNTQRSMSEPAAQLPLNVTVSPEVLSWKGCQMQIGFSALAPTKSVHMSIAVMYSFFSNTYNQSNPLALTRSSLQPTKQLMGTNRHIFHFCSKDVLAGSSQCDIVTGFQCTCPTRLQAYENSHVRVVRLETKFDQYSRSC